MDSEDHNHFKTIAGRYPEPRDAWRKQQSEASSVSGPGPAYYLKRAEMIFACYRRDEAANPEIYAAAAAAILEGYTQSVIERITDPRTGIASQCRFLPSIAEITEACEQEAVRQSRLAAPRRRVIEYVPPPVLPGQITYQQHLELAAAGKTDVRPVGRFEKPPTE